VTVLTSDKKWPVMEKDFEIEEEKGSARKCDIRNGEKSGKTNENTKSV
jgi:hypothetical protein